MLNKLDYRQLELVLSLIQDYIYQKSYNNVLNAWIKLKQISKKSNHSFSNASFAQPEYLNIICKSKMSAQSYTERRKINHKRTNTFDLNHDHQKRKQLLQIINHKRTSTFDHNHDNQKRKQLLLKIKKSIHEIKSNQIDVNDDQFEDIVLAKLRNIQQKLFKVKSTKSNSSIADSSYIGNHSRFQKNIASSMFQFNPNVRYIPIRDKNKNMQSLVREQQIYTIPSRQQLEQCDHPPININQTPTISRRQSGTNVYTKKDHKLKQNNKYLEQSTVYNLNIRQVLSCEISPKNSSRISNILPLSLLHDIKRNKQTQTIDVSQIMHKSTIDNFKEYPMKINQKSQDKQKQFNNLQRNVKIYRNNFQNR